MKGKIEMSIYTEFKAENSTKLDKFISQYMVFAFGQEQYERKLKELGLTDAEFQKYYVGFLGGAMRADKVEEYKQITEEMHANMRNKMLTNKEFAKEAFNYEMGNFEVFYSSRYDEVFGSLCVSRKDLAEYPDLADAFQQAKKEYWDWCIENC